MGLYVKDHPGYRGAHGTLTVSQVNRHRIPKGCKKVARGKRSGLSQKSELLSGTTQLGISRARDVREDISRW